ncbi:hypothetical protein QYF36_022515 [Acer negundo]|nr:hypothetical protein QYF36_022515 [Acer negundo]
MFMKLSGLLGASSNSSRSHLCMSQRPISLDLFHQNKVWHGVSHVPSIPKEWYAGLPQSNTLFIWPQASVLPQIPRKRDSINLDRDTEELTREDHHGPLGALTKSTI